MPTKKFSPTQIQQTLDQVLTQHDLTIEHTMSTSGEFFVKTATKGKRRFLLKIRQINTPEYKHRFLVEINSNLLLKKKQIKHLQTSKLVAADVGLTPEYLLYEFVPGYPISEYYYYIDVGADGTHVPRLLKSHLIQAITKLQTLQKSDFPKNAQPATRRFKENYAEYKQHESALAPYTTPAVRKQANDILHHFKHILDKAPLVFTHGDLNPKNILLNNTKVSLVDFSDVHFNNPLYDLCTLYMYAWKRPSLYQAVRTHIFEQYTHLDDVDKLYILNRIILTPKILAITKNSINGIKQDLDRKHITKQQADDHIQKATWAIQTHVTFFHKLVEHMSAWTRTTPLTNTIDYFSNPNTAAQFLHSNSKQLGLGAIQDVTNKNFRLTILSDEQKLISEYTIHSQQRVRQIMAKIRMERGDDLAHHSYKLLQAIWQNKKTKELISEPLAYYPEHHLFLYEKTPGISVAEQAIQPATSTQQLHRMITQTSNVLSKLHTIPLSAFDGITFVENYTPKDQLTWFKQHLKNNKKYNTEKSKSLIKLIATELNSITLPATERMFIHGDAQLENFIIHNNKIRVIDFDNAVLADPLIDVGNLINQMNYHGELTNEADTLRRLFFDTYTKSSPLAHHPDYFKRVNIYCVMGIIKNLNHNFHQQHFDSIDHDFNLLHYITKRLDQDPVTNRIDGKISS